MHRADLHGSLARSAKSPTCGVEEDLRVLTARLTTGIDRRLPCLVDPDATARGVVAPVAAPLPKPVALGANAIFIHIHVLGDGGAWQLGVPTICTSDGDVV